MPSTIHSRVPLLPPAADPSTLPSGSAPSLRLVRATPTELIQAALINASSWSGPLSEEAYIRREHHLRATAQSRDGGLTGWILIDTNENVEEGLPRTILAACESLRKRALVVKRPKTTPQGQNGHSTNGHTNGHTNGTSNGTSNVDHAATVQQAQVEEVVSHGIGSVFCRPEYRGKGYAARMMAELSKELQTWQQSSRAQFNVLYSDIGKRFYAKNGWLPFPSAHVSLSPISPLKSTTTASADDNSSAVATAAPAKLSPLPETTPILDADLDALCAADEALLRTQIARFSPHPPASSSSSSSTPPSSSAAAASKPPPHIRVALIPDANTMRWHHAREEFLGTEVRGEAPRVKGASVRTSQGRQVWAVWTRVWSRKHEENTLYVLRLAVEGEDEEAAFGNGVAASGGEGQEPRQQQQEDDRVLGVAAVLRAAREEAGMWGMGKVEVWNPSQTVLAGARVLDEKVEVVDREEDSIASLLWYGEGNAVEDVEWVRNEKFAWC